MRRHHMPEINEGRVNVTPLIDIVMCLIIFFMLVARIGVDTGGDREVVVPASFLGVDLKDLGNTLTLNVSNGPPIVGQAPQPIITALVEGKRQEIHIVSVVDGKTVYPLFELLSRLKNTNSNFKVILRADQDTEYQYIQPVLAECTRARVSYDFATQRGQAPPQ